MIAAVALASWLSITVTRPINSKDIEQPMVFAPPTQKDAALVVSLLDHEDRRIRSEAAWCLGDSHLSDMNPSLARQLGRESNDWVRSDLLHAMGKLTDQQDPSAVAAGLRDPAEPARRWAMWTLGEWQASPLLPVVAQRATNDEFESVRVSAAETLGRFETAEAQIALLAVTRDASPRVRRAAAVALGNFNETTEEGIKALLEMLKDADPLVRAAAVSSLANVSNFPVEGPVAEMASDDFSLVRKRVAGSLRKLGAKDRVQTTLGLLDDPDMSVRMEAAAALASFQKGEAIEPLIARMNDGDKFVRRAASRALVDLRLNDDIVPKLISELKQRADRVRREASWALGECRDKRGTLPLIAVLADADRETSLNSIQALGKIADPLALESLRDKLQDELSAKRAMAAWALGELRDKRATAALILVLDDRVLEPRLEAATAAGKIADSTFVKALLTVLQNVTTEHFATRGAASWSLGLIGDSRAVPRLRQMVSEKVIPTPFGPVYDHDSVRMNSCIALTKIARVLANAGQRPTISSFLEKQFESDESSDTLKECISECLYALTAKRYEFTRHQPSPKEYFIRSIETRE